MKKKTISKEAKLNNLIDKLEGSKINPLIGLDGQLMVVAAHRYCLGRQSYIVGSCRDWLKSWWNHFERNTKRVIVRDTIEAIQEDSAGSDYDKADWLAFSYWAYGQLEKEDKDWCRQTVAHNNKPWPLTIGE